LDTNYKVIKTTYNCPSQFLICPLNVTNNDVNGNVVETDARKSIDDVNVDETLFCHVVLRNSRPLRIRGDKL